MRLLILCAAALSLAACATTGPGGYGPATASGFGYDEQRIEDGRYRIVYRGSAGETPEQVETFALRRAAELTLGDGYDWFRVLSSDTSGEERGGVSLGAGVGTGSYGRRGGVSVGVGGDLGRVGAQRYYTVRMDILMGAGERPDDSNVYSAQSVDETIAPESAASEPVAE